MWKNLFDKIEDYNIEVKCGGWSAHPLSLISNGWELTKYYNKHTNGYVVQAWNKDRNVVCKGFIPKKTYDRARSDPQHLPLVIQMKGFSGVKKDHAQKLEKREVKERESLSVLETLQKINGTMEKVRKSYVERQSSLDNIVNLEYYIKESTNG